MRKIVYILFLLLFSAVSARNPRFLFENLSIGDGLASPVVHCIAQDTTGYLWFGTEEGLNRFDGYAFRTYRQEPENPACSLSNSLIKCMLVDRSGRLWLGTGRGLNRYDARTDSFQIPTAVGDTARVLSNSIVRALYEDVRGGVFIGTQSGLFRYDPATETLRAYPLPPGENADGNIIVNLCPGPAGRLWVCTYDGLLSLDPVSGAVRPYPLRMRYPHDPENNLVLCVTADPEDESVAWVGTETGLHRLELTTGSYRTYRTESGTTLSNNVIKCIFPLGRDTLLLGTDKGLNVFSKKSGSAQSCLHDLSDPLNIADNAVDQIFRDAHGICWFATRNGIARLSPYANSIGIFDLKALTQCKNTTGESLRMYGTPSGGCWLAVADEVMYVAGPEGAVRRFRSEYPVMNVQVFHVDSRGIVWIGSKNGLWYLDRPAGMFRPASPETGGPDSRFINDIAEDGAGNLWVTGTGCIYRLRVSPGAEAGVWAIRSEKIQLQNTSAGVSSLFADRTGCIWAAAGNDRLFRYDPQTRRFDRFDAENGRGLVSLRVNLFFGDRDGKLHAVTDTGLYAYDSNTGLFSNRMPAELIDCSRIRACRADGANACWMLLEKGLVRLSPDGRMRMWDFKALMPNSEFVKNGLFFGADGTMLAGHTSGWLKIVPQHLPENGKVSRPRITGVDILDANSLWYNLPFDAAQPLRLTHSRNNVRISFSKLDNLFGNNLYTYRLTGVDDVWQTGFRNSASYINLPPGHYLFRVRDASGSGTPEEETALQIVVTPPWWATPAAWAVYLLLAAALGLALWRAVCLRIRRLQREHAEQREHYLRYMTVGAAGQVAEPADESASAERTDPFLAQLLELINAEIRNENLDIRLLCDRLLLTHKSLYRRVKSLTGLNINELIRYVRLKEAARLLVETDKSISEISFEVGFAHRSYFSKCFVDHYALSPKDFREKYGK